MLNGKMVGIYNGNSFNYKLKRSKDSQVFTFKKEGYKDVEITLTTTLDNIFWVNILFGACAPCASSTDSWLTGASREYSPGQYFVEMKKG